MGKVVIIIIVVVGWVVLVFDRVLGEGDMERG